MARDTGRQAELAMLSSCQSSVVRSWPAAAAKRLRKLESGIGQGPACVGGRGGRRAEDDCAGSWLGMKK